MRDEKTQVYLEEDKGNELWIRAESANPTEVIFRHKILTFDKDLIPNTYLNDQATRILR